MQDADLALVVTAHPIVDHDAVLTRARLVVDLRGITRGSRVENVVRGPHAARKEPSPNPLRSR